MAAKGVGIALLALAAVMLAITGGRVMAHGNPEIGVKPNPAPAGSTITIEGQEFEENDEISLTLEGISGSLPLATAMADAEGSFHVEVTLPEAAAPGTYQIKAEGSDAIALADLRLTAAPGGGPLAPEHETTLSWHRGGPAEEVIALSIVMAAFVAVGVGLVLVRERVAR